MKKNKNCLFIEQPIPISTLRVIFTGEEEKDNEGIRHLCEHIMTHQVIDEENRSLFSLVEYYGGRFEAWTNSLEVSFSAKFPSSANQQIVPAILERLLDFDFCTLTDNQLSQHIDEIKTERTNYSSSVFVLREEMEKIRYIDGWLPILSTESSLAGLTVERVQDFGKRFFQKENSRIVFATDRPQSETNNLFRPIKWRNHNLNSSKKLNGFNAVLIDSKEQFDNLIVSIPSELAAHDIRADWTLDFLIQLIAGSSNCMYVDLSIDRFLYPSTSTIKQTAGGASFGLAVLSLPHTDETPSIFKIILSKIVALSKGAVDRELVEKVRMTIINRLDVNLNDSEYLADWYEYLLVRNLPLNSPDDYRNFIKRISQATLSKFILKNKLCDRVQFGITTSYPDQANIGPMIKLFRN